MTDPDPTEDRHEGARPSDEQRDSLRSGAIGIALVAAGTAGLVAVAALIAAIVVALY